jgi:hypothetical protein
MDAWVNYRLAELRAHSVAEREADRAAGRES